MPLIAESKYETMRQELLDVVNIFTDDTKDSEQTIQIITQISEAAIAVQGLGEVPDTNDKAKVVALMMLESAVEKLKDSVVEKGV